MREVGLEREDADEAIEVPEVEVERELRQRDLEQRVGVRVRAAADLHRRRSLRARRDGRGGVGLLERERLERRDEDAEEPGAQHGRSARSRRRGRGGPSCRRCRTSNRGSDRRARCPRAAWSRPSAAVGASSSGMGMPVGHLEVGLRARTSTAAAGVTPPSMPSVMPFGVRPCAFALALGKGIIEPPAARPKSTPPAVPGEMLFRRPPRSTCASVPRSIADALVLVGVEDAVLVRGVGRRVGRARRVQRGARRRAELVGEEGLHLALEAALERADDEALHEARVGDGAADRRWRSRSSSRRGRRSR